MALLKIDTTAVIKGKLSGTIFKNDKYGTHQISKALHRKKAASISQLNRRAAYRKCCSFITNNYTNEMLHLWQQYGDRNLQWNHKFIAFNINRVIVGKPIIRYPPEFNLIKNGNFEEGNKYWDYTSGWQICNYRAYYKSTLFELLCQVTEFTFAKNKMYILSYEIEYIRNSYMWVTLGRQRGINHYDKGFYRDKFTPTRDNTRNITFNAIPQSGLGEMSLYNITLTY